MTTVFLIILAKFQGNYLESRTLQIQDILIEIIKDIHTTIEALPGTEKSCSTKVSDSISTTDRFVFSGISTFC